MKQNIWEDIKKWLLKILIGFSWMLFVFTIAWVILAALVFPYQDGQYFRQFFEDDYGRVIEVWGPKIVTNESVSQIYVTLHQNANTASLPLRVSIPIEFIIKNADKEQYRHNVILTFSGKSRDETLTIDISNAHLSSWISATREIEIFQVGDGKLGEVQIKSESLLRATLRQYGGGADEIPFFPLATLVVAIVGIVYKQFEQERLEKEQARQEKEQEKKDAESALEKIKSAMKRRNFVDAQKIMEEYERNPQSDPAKKAVVRDLIDISNSKAIDKGIENFNEWENELAAGLIYAEKKHSEDIQGLFHLFREFPEGKLESNLKDEFDSIKREVLRPLQLRDRMLPAKVDLPHFSTLISGLDKNPFPEAKAESEENVLFSKPNLFWAGHPLLEKLLNVKGGAFVHGQSGSGKTALSLFLGKYHEDKDIFTCYLPGAPDMQETRTAFLGRLLQQIKKFPSFLILLSDAQRVLLSELLVDEFGKEKASHEIDLVDLGEILRNASGEAKKIWKAQITTHLDLLKKAIAAAPFHHFTDTQWLAAFAVCIRALEFSKSIYFLIDAGDEFNLEWYRDIILRRRDLWLDTNFYPIVFSSQPIPERELKENFWVKSFELIWDAAQIAEMAKHRWQYVYSFSPFASILPDTSLAQMIKLSQNNPRCFSRLWNETAKNNDKLPFTVNSIRKAKEKISCR